MVNNLGLLSAELSATCNALGYYSGTTYYTDPYVKETLTDLIRYLRRDDEDHTIRRHLGSAKVLQTDLLPILEYHHERGDLFDVLLRLLVNLTNPALLIYQEELPSDRTARHYFLIIISQLQSYKEAFTNQKVWEILTKKLGDLLQVEYYERDEDQSRTIERILILIRNVLQVPADQELEKRPDNDASVHDQVLWSLHLSGMVDLLLYIATTDNEQQFYMHVLEIVSLMLREQNPATLASAALQRSVEEKERDEKELLEIRRREIVDKQSKIKKYAGSRHSRFGGTFIVKDVKSISERDLIFHKPLSKAVSLTFNEEKQKSKVPRNKTSLLHNSAERRSAFSVRLFLKEFCVEFLNGAYNTLMYKVRENLVRAVGQPNDETYYFWAMKFFMEFNRLYKFQVKFVSETMHQHIFHFVQTQMENWLEHMITDKKKIPLWSRRIHQALKAYQELLMTLQAMDKSPDQPVRESAKIIKSNIFYQSEYRELIVYLFNVYNETKFSKAYLKDLVETEHIFLKMLEQFCSRHQNLIVQGKARKRIKRKKKTAKKSGPTVANLEARWDQVGPDLSAVLQNQVDIPADIVPFDATSSLTMDKQKIEAMKKIQMELKQRNFEQAVGLLRASREVWPENDSFGHENMAADEEFMAMREIFMTDIGLAETAEPDGDDEEESEEDEEDPRDIVVPEQSFKFIEFVARFACPKVLSAVCQLLEHFDSNTTYTNHCIVKLLHRVAWDCKMPAMLFQASLFRTFQRIFSSQNPEHKELVKFAIFIMRKFAEMAKNNKKIYMELLFWKSKREAEEMEMGYNNTDKKSHSSKNVWREEQEDELRRLAEEYERDTPEPDAVGWIMKNMIDQTRSRRAVIKKMKELYLVIGNMKPKSKLPKEFSEEEVEELKTLYEQFKDAPDPMNCILGRISVPRNRRALVDKLIELGLVVDRKQLRKKSSKKRNASNADEWGQRSDDESIYDTSDDDAPQHVKEKKRKKANIQRSGQPSVTQICCYLRRVMDTGLSEPLEWLQSSLQEVLEDLAEGEDEEEGTALLPLTTSAIQAMENPTFLQLLDILSIDKPTDQEIYWRIPGRWKSEDLTKRINLIKDALEGKLPDINPDEVEEQVSYPGIPKEQNKHSSDKSPKLKKKLNKSSNGYARDEDSGSGSDRQSSEGETNDSDSKSSDEESIDKTDNHKKGPSNSVKSDSDEEFISSAQTSVSKKYDSRTKTFNSSDSENDIATIKSDSTLVKNHELEHTNKNANSAKRKRIHIQVGSDDDAQSDDGSNMLDSPISKNISQIFSNVTKRKKVTIKSDSEDEKIVINSSNSNNTSPTKEQKSNNSILSQIHPRKSNIQTQTLRKKRIIIGSDSEDESNTTVNSAKMNSSPSQESEMNYTTQNAKRKRIDIDSDSEDDSNVTVNSTKHNSSPSQQSELNDTTQKSKKNKRISIESDSEDENNITVNSTRSILSPSQESELNNTTQKSKKNKRISIESDSDDDKNITVNSTKSILSPSQESELNNTTQKSKKNKRISIESDSEDENNITVNSTRSILSPSQESELNNTTQKSKKNKRISIESDSDDDKNITVNSTKSILSPSQESELNNTTQKSKKNKRISIESDSDDDKNITVNSTKSILSPSQESELNNTTQKSKKNKRISIESDSDDDKNITVNSTKSILSPSQESELNNTTQKSKKNKRISIESDSDDDKNITVNSTKSILSPSQESELNNTTQKSKKNKRISIESDSDDDKNITVNSTKSILSPSQESELNNTTQKSKKNKRISIESDSDDDKNITVNSTKSILSPSQESELNNTTQKSKKSKRISIESDFEEEKNTTVHSTKSRLSPSQESELNETTPNSKKIIGIEFHSEVDNTSINSTKMVSSPIQHSELNDTTQKSKKNKRISIESDSEDENNVTVNSTKSTLSPSQQSELNNTTQKSKKNKRISIESDSEDEKTQQYTQPNQCYLQAKKVS